MKDEIGNYEITFSERPTAEDVGVLSQGLHRFGDDIFGPTWVRSIAFFLRDGEGKIAGGVYGNYGSFGWSYVDSLWVSDEVRGLGFGSQLLDAFETEVLKHNCPNIFLSTFSFQAPEFYKKLGYEIFGELDDFPDGHSRIFFRKRLS